MSHPLGKMEFNDLENDPNPKKEAQKPNNFTDFWVVDFKFRISFTGSGWKILLRKKPWVAIKTLGWHSIKYWFGYYRDPYDGFLKKSLSTWVVQSPKITQPTGMKWLLLTGPLNALLLSWKPMTLLPWDRGDLFWAAAKGIVVVTHPWHRGGSSLKPFCLLWKFAIFDRKGD